MKKIFYACLILLGSTQLFAQQPNVWQGVTPNIPDTVGCQALDAVSSQVAWALSQKYDAADSLYNLPNEPSVWVHRTTDGGLTWSTDSAPNIGGIPFMISLSGLDADHAWVTGVDFNTFQSFAFQTQNGGLTWTRELDSLFDTPGGFLNYVYFWDTQQGIAMGDPSATNTDTLFQFEIHHTTDGGQTWVRMPRTSLPAPDADEYGLNYRVLGNHVWFITTNSRMYHSSDRGQTWTVSQTNFVGAFLNISFADSLVGILGGYDFIDGSIGLNLTLDGGATWSDITPQDSAYLLTSAVIVPGTRVIVLVVRNSNLTGPFRTWASYNLGLSWTEIGQGANAGWAEFLDENTGYAGEWQNPNGKGQYYTYSGSPLLGLLGHDALEARLSLAPNPASDHLVVTLAADHARPFTLLLHDLQGRLLHQESSESTLLWTPRLDLSNLPAGIYSVTVSDAQGRITEKFVKQ